MRYLITTILLVSAAAEQPGAAAPVTAPQRGLPFGELNFLQTTDIHGWYPGHLKRGQYSADFGDYYSFIKQLRKTTEAAGADLIVVDTGDRVEGNGFYDASNPKGLYTYEVIKKIDYDVLVPGNHEFYQRNTTENEYFNVAEPLKKVYVASNLDYVDSKTGTRVPFGQRYRIFRTKNQGIKVLAFGFIFNFIKNADNVIIQMVEKTVQETWFQNAIREPVDLFLICAHIPLDKLEMQVIYRAIRRQNKHTPIQIFGAHSHIRNFVKYDSRAYGLQSGKFFETIGFASISGLKTSKEAGGTTDELTFQRRYLDNNIIGYYYHTGLNSSTFPTDEGKNISNYIREAREKLDLDHVYGCVPRNLYRGGSGIAKQDNIFTWLVNDFMPDIVTKNPQNTKSPTIISIATGFLRSDLMKGRFTRDTSYIITPFTDILFHVKNFPYKTAIIIIENLNKDPNFFSSAERALPNLQDVLVRTHPRDISMNLIDQYIRNYDGQRIFSSSSKSQVLVPGYITKDDGGSDGDDTLHIPLKSIDKFPRVEYTTVQFPEAGEPNTVDFIFPDYAQRPILDVSRKIGFNFSDSNIEIYRKELLRDLMVQWIEKNWAGDC